MSHFKCDGCRLRLHHPQTRAELVSLVCPGCGAALQPARQLDEIVGYRAIETRGPATSDDSGFPEALAQRMVLPDPDRTIY
jgi:hypothetical protein